MIQPIITNISSNVIVAVNKDKTIQKIIKFSESKDLIFKEYKNYLKLMFNEPTIIELFDIYKECQNFNKNINNCIKIPINTDNYFLIFIKDFKFKSAQNSLYLIMSDYNPSKISLHDFIIKNNDFNKILRHILTTLSNLDVLYSKYGFIHCDFHTKNILVNDSNISFIDLEMSKFIDDNKTIKYEDLDIDYFIVKPEFILTKRFMHFADIFIFTVYVYSDLSYNKKIAFLLYLNANISSDKLFMYFYIIFVNYHIYITNNIISKSNIHLTTNLSHRTMKILLNVFNFKTKTMTNLFNNSIFNNTIDEIYDILDEIKNENNKYINYEPVKEKETWKELMTKYSTKKLILKCSCKNKATFIFNATQWNSHIKTEEHLVFI
jgi:hypothetical protein